ncbi:carnitine O-palmitoyltransferase 2, mitochondrial-like isoform X1 [Ceratina calcarata]|uniref:Carnitine O-palmitoyltransferase 2, mitochondrial-like isoform X1 n=1 Tax=Ceratina calcarata TaxID=156304 RepID=A0AAJ7N8D3_9HYME|nr:carnitine O-palmitoyltransferase 2, mitochondrial-like isoform X1 [Ceratina calcarata]
MHFQPSLPRLPIPKLEDTCKRYLSAQKPLLSEDQFKKTTIYVNEFLSKDGTELQRRLIEKNAKNVHTSYISKPWFDLYLKDRKSLPINYNPFLVLLPTSDPNYNTQLVQATNLVISSLRFMKSLKENILRPEIFFLKPKTANSNIFQTTAKSLPPKFSWYGAYLFKAFPLDMSQYHNLFNTTRLPKLEKDEIYEDKSGKHIIVMRKGNFFTFDVIDEDGYIYEPHAIASCLKFILEDNTSANEYPIGVLTTSKRDLWADARNHLSHIGNHEILQKIDSAIFMMILDDESIGTDSNNVIGVNYNKLLRTYLHADGTNRWFDKSFSLIVTQDGHAGINFEHSWGDGVAVLRFLTDIHKDITKQPRFCRSDIEHLPQGAIKVKKLQFNIDNKVQDIINTEKRKYVEWINELNLDHVIFTEFGKNKCKKFGYSSI